MIEFANRANISDSTGSSPSQWSTRYTDSSGKYL